MPVVDSLVAAWNRMLLVCFRPFDLRKWFILGFCAWLAQLGEGGVQFPNFGGGGGGGSRSGGQPSGSPDFGQVLQQWLPVIIVVGVVLLVLAVALGLIVLWLQCRGTFMFLDGLVHNRGAVREPWRRFARHGNRLFVFRVIFGAIVLVVVGLIVGLALLVALGDIMAGRFGVGAAVGCIVGGLLLLLLVFVAAIVAALIHDFVVPVMYRSGEGPVAACRIVLREVLPGRVGQVALFYLLRLVVEMGVGMATFLVGCLTCCVGFCLMALPYLGAVVLLPVSVFFRCWSVSMLEMIRPEWTIFPPLAGGAAPPEPGSPPVLPAAPG